MYETRAYDNEHGEPVVVIVATGEHDVSRLVNLFARGNPVLEQSDLSQKIVRQVKRHNGGQAALRLLKLHGGADFTEDTNERQLAKDLFAIAAAGGMPNTYWFTDRRIKRACEVLKITPYVAQRYGYFVQGRDEE